MKIEKFVKQKNSKYKLVGTPLVLYDETILKYELMTKKVINESLVKEIVSYDAAIKTYLDLTKKIKAKLKTEDEVIKILNKTDLSKEYQNKILDKLKDLNLINDDIYADAYINSVVALKLDGPRKITADLLKLGIHDTTINKYLDVIDASIWNEKINKLINKKIKANHNKSGQTLKIKIAMEIVHLGYQKEMVMNQIDNYSFINLEAVTKRYIKEYHKLENKYDKDKVEQMVRYKMLSLGFSNDELDQIKTTF
jgi:regulatory protein